MDLTDSTEALKQFIQNGKGQVLGLSGRWGAGKTHLWLSVRKELRVEQAALYSSCFGLKSLDEIGRALLQDFASNASEYGEAGGKVINQIGGKLTTALRKVPFIGEATDALLATGALAESLLTSMVVRDRIVVLDDLERRDAALSLETLFGHVDALKGRGCTVLLIYNEEELSANQGQEWRAVREKCLDVEINLRPTPAEACKLGLSSTCPDSAAIVTAAKAVGLTNIRILKRIERLTAAFRGAISDQYQPMPAYIVHSLVFLAVLHYENRFPDHQVEKFLEEWAQVCADQLSNTPHSDAASLAKRCNATNDPVLLSLLSDFVQHHPLDTAVVVAHMRALDKWALNQSALTAAVHYVDLAIYDPDATDQTFLDMAGEWGATGWEALAPQLASTIILDLERRGGQNLVLDMAMAWRKHWLQFSTEYVEQSILQGMAEPIAQTIREVNESRSPVRTVMEAINEIEVDPSSATNAGMLRVLQNISPGELRIVIENYKWNELKRFLTFYTEHLPKLEHKYDTYKLAWGHFQVAAEKIILENNKPRLSEILLRHVQMLCPDFDPMADQDESLLVEVTKQR